jgi:hypothetical protein
MILNGGLLREVLCSYSFLIFIFTRCRNGLLVVLMLQQTIPVYKGMSYTVPTGSCRKKRKGRGQEGRVCDFCNFK